MASSFSITRSIGRKWFAGLSNYPIVRMIESCSSLECCRYRFNSFYPKGMSTLAEPMRQNHPSSSSSSPWLMLPPSIDVTFTGAASISYNFYSLADNKIVTHSLEDRELTNPLMVCAGSSLGWLALMSPSRDLFLYNTISRRRINLPSVGDLPDYPDNLATVYKVVLSCSPEDPNCRAIIIYNNVHGLAFCCPGFSKEWTHIGDHNWFDENLGRSFRPGYRDCVYSTRHEALFSLTKQGVLESWDLWDPHSPRAVKIAEDGEMGGKICYAKQKHLLLTCAPVEHLVVAGQDQDLLVVTQYVVETFDLDGLYVDGCDPSKKTVKRGLPSSTIDFDVKKYNLEDEDVKYVDSLDGLALFVGFQSDAVALWVAEFPELKSNSIYFTDGVEDGLIEDYPTGGHDIGIYDYENKTVSPCCYPCDIKKMKKTFPAPMWFFPTPA
ncbi:hypothetical protein STAS_30891 [Striga asiatica]|uniref:KIB1-4 beta-propeller domain-containing protein n=1 Tax=Striga asiatica TaxID=4170 RepID=A0A5A7RAP1_STRAF|nr:hypothetical protein STAS_30891 [Striga asiatica]